MSRIGEQLLMDFEREMEAEMQEKEFWERMENDYVGPLRGIDNPNLTRSIDGESEDLLGTSTGHTEGSPLLKQVGGTHYNKHNIQPWDIIDEYGLGYYEGNIIKYVLRSKGDRLEDLKKAQHYLEKEIAAWE